MSENAPWTTTPLPASADATPANAPNTPDKAPIPAESTRLTVEIVNSAAPSAAIEPAVTAIEATNPLFASIHFVNELMTAVIRSTIGLIVEFKASPVAFIARGALRLLRSSRFALTRPDAYGAGASQRRSGRGGTSRRSPRPSPLRSRLYSPTIRFVW